MLLDSVHIILYSIMRFESYKFGRFVRPFIIYRTSSISTDIILISSSEILNWIERLQSTDNFFSSRNEWNSSELRIADIIFNIIPQHKRNI